MNQRSMMIKAMTPDELDRELDSIVGYMHPKEQGVSNEVIHSIACLSVVCAPCYETGGYEWIAFLVVNMDTLTF